MGAVYNESLLSFLQGFETLLDSGRKFFEQSAHIYYRLYRMGASSSDKNIERSSYKVLLNRKALLIRKNLKKRHFQMLYIVQKLVSFGSNLKIGNSQFN